MQQYIPILKIVNEADLRNTQPDDTAYRAWERSDSPGKAMYDDPTYLAYAKAAFGLPDA